MTCLFCHVLFRKFIFYTRTRNQCAAPSSVGVAALTASCSHSRHRLRTTTSCPYLLISPKETIEWRELILRVVGIA